MQKRLTSYIQERNAFYDLMTDEIKRAEKKFPKWPIDIIHGVAIMQEEAGEAIQKSIQCIYDGNPIKELEEELIQTATMAMRMWFYIKRAQNK